MAVATQRGKNIASKLWAEQGRVLCAWEDAGWGELVRKGTRQDGDFADDLVTGAVELIQQLGG